MKDVSAATVEKAQAVEGLSPFPGKVQGFNFVKRFYQIVFGCLPMLLFQVHPAARALGNCQASTSTSLFGDGDGSGTVSLLHLRTFTCDHRKFGYGCQD